MLTLKMPGKTLHGKCFSSGLEEVKIEGRGQKKPSVKDLSPRQAHARDTDDKVM